MSSTTVVYTIRLTYLLTAILNWMANSIVISYTVSQNGPDYKIIIGTLLFTIVWQLLWLISMLHVAGQRTRWELYNRPTTSVQDQSGRIKFD